MIAALEVILSEGSDFERLRALIDPAGFFYQLYQTDGSQPITADQAVDRIKRGTVGGKLQVTVQRRPLLPRGQFQPDGDLYMVSTWMQYDNRPAHLALQVPRGIEERPRTKEARPRALPVLHPSRRPGVA